MRSWWKCEVYRWVVCHGMGLSSGLDPMVFYIFYRIWTLWWIRTKPRAHKPVWFLSNFTIWSKGNFFIFNDNKLIDYRLLSTILLGFNIIWMSRFACTSKFLYLSFFISLWHSQSRILFINNYLIWSEWPSFLLPLAAPSDCINGFVNQQLLNSIQWHFLSPSSSKTYSLFNMLSHTATSHAVLLQALFGTATQTHTNDVHKSHVPSSRW